MGVVFLLYCSRARVLKVQWGAYKLVKRVEPLGVQPFPTWGTFPFTVQGGASIYIYLALYFGTVGVRFVLVSCRGLILAIFSGKG